MSTRFEHEYGSNWTMAVSNSMRPVSVSIVSEDNFQAPPDFETRFNGKWVKHVSNEEIVITEMDDEHLKRTIAMIQRGFDAAGRKVSPDRERFLPHLISESRRRQISIPEEGWDQ
jgi:hypothetical protein